MTALSVMLEWQRDWAEKDSYDAIMDTGICLGERPFNATSPTGGGRGNAPFATALLEKEMGLGPRH